MKRNDGFGIPQRQSQWAIIFIVLKFLRRFISQLWPIILAFVIGSRNQGFDRFEMAISVIGILSMATSILSYYKYYYHISAEELIIQKGVLKKVKLNIPFNRIQSINFNQNFLHQALGVTEVEIETAGTDKSELQIDALTLDTAKRLRNLLLEKRNKMSSGLAGSSRDVSTVEQPESILELNSGDLIKVGLVQNHFKPVGLMIGLAGSAMAYSYTIGIDYRDAFEYVMDIGSGLTISHYLLLIIFLIPIAILYSVVTTFLRHFNLKFTRTTEKFHVVRGLLTKKQFTAIDKKIQIFSWGQNPFERLTGLYNIFFRQAKAGGENQTRMSLKIPGCRLEKVQYVKESWLGKRSGRFNEVNSISKHFFIRSAFYQCLFFASAFGITLVMKGFYYALIVLLLWGLAIFTKWLEWKKKRYAFNQHEIYIGGGILGFNNSILPIYKVQNMNIVQNPYQWRRNLATLMIHTAGGHLTIPYIPEEEALYLLNTFITRVEKSEKAWM